MLDLAFDSTDPAAVPAGAAMIWYYVDGRYAWPQSALDRFTGRRLVGINVTGDPSHGGTMLDVERYDATPAQAPGWYDARLATGARDLAIYCSRDALPAVRQAMGGRAYKLAVATLDGSVVIPGYSWPRTPAAVQAIPARWLPFNCDASLVFDAGWVPSPALSRALTNAHDVTQLGHTMTALVAQLDTHAHWLAQRLAELT